MTKCDVAAEFSIPDPEWPENDVLRLAVGHRCGNDIARCEAGKETRPVISERRQRGFDIGLVLLTPGIR